MVLGSLTVGQYLNVLSSNGPLTQVAGTGLTVAGTTTLAAPGHDITLDSPLNQLLGIVNARGRNVTLTNAASSGLLLGDIDASGSLSVTALAGSIGQTSAGRIAVSGETRMNAPAGQVNLRTTGNAIAGNLLIDGVLRNGLVAERAPSSPTRALPSPEQAPPALFAAAGERGGAQGAAAQPRVGGSTATGTVVALLSAPVARAPGTIMVTLAPRSANAGFMFVLPQPLVAQIRTGLRATAAMPDGAALPGWLRFNADDGSFTSARVPEGSLPMRVVVTLADQRFDVTIREAQPANR